MALTSSTPSDRPSGDSSAVSSQDIAERIAERIIVALDVPDGETALALVAAVPEVRFWKVGLELFLAAGPPLLADLKAQGKRIFLDLKFHDIPNTMASACRVAGGYGVDLLTVHAAAGSAALAAAQAAAQAGAAAAHLPPPQVIAVTVLTSIPPATLASELQVPTPLPTYAHHLAQMAQGVGLAGVVCSPWEAAPLRSALGAEFLLVCPGVRPQGSAHGDQGRVMTPRAAISAGASYLVIGRPITQAADPAQAFQNICIEIASPTP